jgi:N-acetyl-gamma-glutamyl-phosphate reductase
MIRAGVVGATGYAGAELVRLLSDHPGAELTVLTSRQFAGMRFDQVYPVMCGIVNLVCEEISIERLANQCDVIFTALPHKIPMKIVPELILRNKKVIDLSADFRFNDASIYESTYQPHTSRELCAEAVYGLCEIYEENIKTARLIGNPGCYPTSALLPLIPLVQKNMITTETIIVDAKSGVSGAGRSLSMTSHYCEVDESFKAYKVAAHRHNPEIDMVLSRAAGKATGVTFVPHLVPMSRGMLTTIYATLIEQVTADDVGECLSSFYRHRPFVRVADDGRMPDTRHVSHTNYCDIGFKVDMPRNLVILISAIDNLVKGAAGQAVQNMNIMFGLAETSGLMQTPFPV